MIINTKENKLIRESWKEWFRIEVNRLIYYSRGFRLPRGFIKVYSYWYRNRDIDVYWFILFVPFVKFGQLVKRLWWKPAVWLYKKGYFEHQEGEVENWFWFKKIRLGKLKEEIKKAKIKIGGLGK